VARAASSGRDDAPQHLANEAGAVAQSVPAATARSAATSGRLAWRTWLPWSLVVLASVIGVAAALNIWVKRQALNTDNFTNASSQLLEDDQIRGALSVYLVNQLYQNVDVPAALEQRLPPQAKPLAAPLAGALEDTAVRATNQLLARPRVQQRWRNANRRAHEAFIAVLDGKHGALVSSNGNVVLNLQPLVEQLDKRLGLGGKAVEKVPPDAGQIVIMKGNQLETARHAVRVIRVLSYFLLFLVVALYAAAVYLARGRRRRLLMGCGVSVLAVGLIVLVVRRYAGDYLVNALTSNPDEKGAVSRAWAIETQLLRNVGINAVIYGVGIMFAAWIAGASRPATWVRRKLAPTMREHPFVIYGAVALVLFIVLLAGPTDAQRIYPLLVLFGLAFIGTEVLRRETEREFPAMSTASGS
jgi:hypothetical protein